MDLAKQAKIVDSIHDTLHDFVGQRLKVRANMGRSKIVESEGVLMQVHPQLFILEVDRKRGRTSRQSYQYVDVLTGMVELSQNGEPLFEPFVPESADGAPAAGSYGRAGRGEGPVLTAQGWFRQTDGCRKRGTRFAFPALFLLSCSEVSV